MKSKNQSSQANEKKLIVKGFSQNCNRSHTCQVHWAVQLS